MVHVKQSFWDPAILQRYLKDVPFDADDVCQHACRLIDLFIFCEGDIEAPLLKESERAELFSKKINPKYTIAMLEGIKRYLQSRDLIFLENTNVKKFFSDC